MGVKEDFDISNQEAAKLLKNLVHHFSLTIVRGNRHSLTTERYIQAISKAIDILEKTPDDKKKRDSFYGGYKLCPDCYVKKSHPVKEFTGHFYPIYKCPKCRKIWNVYEDE